MENTGKGKKGLALGEPEPVTPALNMDLAAALERIAKLEQERAELIEKKEAQQQAEKRTANESRASTKARLRIIVEEGREKNAQTHVFIGVNGRGYLIKRGIPVDVPPEVVENLKDAVEVTNVAVVDEERGIVVGTKERQVRRFPYTVLGKSYDERGNKLMAEDAISVDSKIL